MTTFGEKITNACKQKKMTQCDLSRTVGTGGDIIGKPSKEERSHLFATTDAFFAQHKLQSLLK